MTCASLSLLSVGRARNKETKVRKLHCAAEFKLDIGQDMGFVKNSMGFL